MGTLFRGSLKGFLMLHDQGSLHGYLPAGWEQGFVFIIPMTALWGLGFYVYLPNIVLQ